MKERKLTDEQIVAILQEAARNEKSIRDLCREKDISENTFYKWRNQFQGMKPAEIKRLRNLESENARLKKLLAERDIEIDAMKEVLAKKW